MKKELDLECWDRKEHYKFFSKFSEPFFGLTVNIDCTKAYSNAKKNEQSFFLYYLYRALKAANSVENFKYRIEGDSVYLYDTIYGSPTVSRPNGTFGFSYIPYDSDEQVFINNAKKVIEEVKQSSELIPASSGANVIHFSAIPWVNFTSLSHARDYNFPDSCPKISFGKVNTEKGVKTFAVSIHVHHGLVDGYHVGLFIDRFQDLMNT